MRSFSGSVTVLRKSSYLVFSIKTVDGLTASFSYLDGVCLGVDVAPKLFQSQTWRRKSEGPNQNICRSSAYGLGRCRTRNTRRQCLNPCSGGNRADNQEPDHIYLV